MKLLLMTAGKCTHRDVFYRGMPVTHMRLGVMPIIHVVDVAVYLLRWLPASWPLSLDQPILLLPHPIDIFFFLRLLKKRGGGGGGGGTTEQNNKYLRKIAVVNDSPHLTVLILQSSKGFRLCKYCYLVQTSLRWYLLISRVSTVCGPTWQRPTTSANTPVETCVILVCCLQSFYIWMHPSNIVWI